MENPCDGFRRAEKGVVGCTLANDFAFDSVLLVSESDSNIRNTGEGVHVIQEGGIGTGVGSALVGEGDVLEFKGLGA